MFSPQRNTMRDFKTKENGDIQHQTLKHISQRNINLIQEVSARLRFSISAEFLPNSRFKTMMQWKSAHARWWRDSPVGSKTSGQQYSDRHAKRRWLQGRANSPNLSRAELHRLEAQHAVVGFFFLPFITRFVKASVYLAWVHVHTAADALIAVKLVLAQLASLPLTHLHVRLILPTQVILTTQKLKLK